MAKSDVEEVTERTIRKGGVLVKLYFDMHSEKQEDLQPVLADLINNKLLKAQGVIYCFGAIDEPIKDKEMYTTSAIVTTLVESMDSLVKVVFSFAPAAIEVMRPSQYVMQQAQLQDLLLSLSTISMNYSEYILKNTMSREEFEKVKGDIRSREELGKRIMDGLKKNPEEKK